MNKPKLKGDRFGGIVFDIQQHRKGEAIVSPRDNDRAIQRDKLIHAISLLITMVEDIDDLEFSNPRIGVIPGTYGADVLRAAANVFDRCDDPDHDRFGQRKTDCTECNPRKSTAHDNREPPRMATICKCENPNCNSGAHFPKACYTCGGIVVAKTCVCPNRRGQPGSHCLTCKGTCDGVQR